MLRPGSEGRLISLRIDKALLTYKKPVEKPVFAITIVNSWGDAIGEPIQTQPGEYDPGSGTMLFGHTITLPLGINDSPDGRETDSSSALELCQELPYANFCVHVHERHRTAGAGGIATRSQNLPSANL